MRRSVILLATAWATTALLTLTTTPGAAQIQKVETKPATTPKAGTKPATKTTTVVKGGGTTTGTGTGTGAQ